VELIVTWNDLITSLSLTSLVG